MFLLLLLSSPAAIVADFLLERTTRPDTWAGPCTDGDPLFTEVTTTANMLQPEMLILGQGAPPSPKPQINISAWAYCTRWCKT